MNPVRAGMVEDPAKYRFSSYGAACSGCKRSQWGYLEMTDGKGWAALSRIYNYILYGKEGVSEEVRGQALAHDGVTPLYVLLRRRVRYFSDGFALGCALLKQKDLEE